jgi:hypothetical protein
MACCVCQHGFHDYGVLGNEHPSITNLALHAETHGPEHWLAYAVPPPLLADSRLKQCSNAKATGH